ncbi:hypothetical protein BGZ94_003440 [Podila epigama]|nr:hypothetical protein BGZ94_003440 [Podila epigama]
MQKIRRDSFPVTSSKSTSSAHRFSFNNGHTPLLNNTINVNPVHSTLNNSHTTNSFTTSESTLLSNSNNNDDDKSNNNLNHSGLGVNSNGSNDNHSTIHHDNLHHPNYQYHTHSPNHHNHPRSRSPDLEAYGSSHAKANRRSRTPSPPLSPSQHHQQQQQQQQQRQQRPNVPAAFFFKRRSARHCLLATTLVLGLLLPAWVLATGAVTLDSFNDAIRYLPGYHHFANNLLYLVMFLLLVSFTVLATLPVLPIYILGLPFHLLIFSIFRKLMSDWVWWCIGCYTILILAPVGSAIVTRFKGLLSLDRRGDILFPQPQQQSTLIRHKTTSSSPSFTAPTLGISAKYTPVNNGTIASMPGYTPFNSNHGSVLSPVKTLLWRSMVRVGQRLEQLVYQFSKTNRASTRWRLILAIALFLSYVIPVMLHNESRIFDPAKAAKSFNIQHPEPLCSAREMSAAGFEDGPRHASFEGYWNEYLEFHATMVRPESEGGVAQSKKRFLVFQPSDDGLGNRLQALLSSVVLAMLSRRAIILDWVATPQCNANFTDLFEHPKGLAWDFNTTLPMKYKDSQEYKSKPEIWYPYCRNCALRSPIDTTSPWSDLLCRQDLGLNSTKPLIQILSTQWFLPVLQHNPYWRAELCQMFPNGGSNAFEVLAKTLLKPAKPVQDKIDSVLSRIPKDATLIGLQVRRTENNAVGHEIEDAFLSCAATAVEEEMAKFETSIYGRPGEDGMRSATLSSRSDFSGFYGNNGNDNDNNSNENADNSYEIIQKGHALGQVTTTQEETVAAVEYLGRRPSARSEATIARAISPKVAYYLATDYRPTRAHFQEVLGDQLYVLDTTFQSTTHSSGSSLVSSSSSSGSDSGYQEWDSSDGTLSSSNDSQGPANVIQQGQHPSGTSTLAKGVPTQREAVARNSVQGVQTAVAEMYLLAHADKIISSPYSTFGYFAHGYANVQPNIVKRDGTCTRRKSTQPCFQYWFGFANGGAACSIRATVEMSEDYDCWL